MKIGLICIFTVLLDQMTKFIVRQMMTISTSIPVVGDFVRLTYVENPGMAFGIRVGNNALFTWISIIACIVIAVTLFLHRKEGTGIQSGLSLVLGGALGNLIDRVLFRHVADFIDIGVRNIRWPVFNIADSAVVIGMVVLFIYLNLAEKKTKKTEVTQEIE